MNILPRYGPPETGDPGTYTFDIDVAPAGTTRLCGTRIGFASSQLEEHNHPVPRRSSAEPHTRCSACRWFEVHLFKTFDGEYVVHTAGISTYIDEVPLIKVSRTRSPYEVVEILTIRRRGEVTVPAPSARVLAQAAEFDDGIFDAYRLGPIPSHSSSHSTRV